ncbi:MAG: hypothetical protein JWP04_2885 [Belnapia sp.]|nr:hypothetical protein [Belnapia sp.]
MPQALKIFLVNKAGELSGHFVAASRKACGDRLKGYFEATIRGVARYDTVSIIWDGKASDPVAGDFVCYLLTAPADSIAATKATGDVTLGASGSTLLSLADKAVISEVYLRAIVQGGDPRGNDTTNKEALVANCILHELAHNLLDATTPNVLDVHKVKDGVICRETGDRPLQGTDQPGPADNAAFQAGFTRRAAGVKQYTSGMPG